MYVLLYCEHTMFYTVCIYFYLPEFLIYNCYQHSTGKLWLSQNNLKPNLSKYPKQLFFQQMLLRSKMEKIMILVQQNHLISSLIIISI